MNDSAGVSWKAEDAYPTGAPGPYSQFLVESGSFIYFLVSSCVYIFLFPVFSVVYVLFPDSVLLIDFRLCFTIIILVALSTSYDLSIMF